MMNTIKKFLRSLLFKNTGTKLNVQSYYNVLKRGQFKFDNYWMDFYDNEVGRRYIVRPMGNPLPLIIDELVKITGNLKDASEIYSKFVQASAAVTKSGQCAFRVKVLIDS